MDIARVGKIETRAFVIPTDEPESDGTLAWDKTTLVLVELEAGGARGLGWTYADRATASIAADVLAPKLRGCDAFAIGAAWIEMARALRNAGRPGAGMMALSAIDVALWDCKARLLGLPIQLLLDRVRDRVPIYGSGGFTSYSLKQLQDQLGGWAAEGIPRVKMKSGTHPQDDLRRVRAAREAVGPDVELFVDANGAYSRKQALRLAEAFAELGVSWFEEPVSSDDLEGLRLLRDRAPAGMDIAAGEYGYDLRYFRHMLDARAVDVLQADATRCAGITGFLQVGALCSAHCLPLSAHCAPALHAHVCCAVPVVRHVEYFHDHARIERLLFDGTLIPADGALHPDLSRPGMGLEFKRADAQHYAV